MGVCVCVACDLCRLARVFMPHVGLSVLQGFEIGSGFSGARMTGSEHNDPFYMDNGAVRTRSNRCARAAVASPGFLCWRLAPACEQCASTRRGGQCAASSVLWCRCVEVKEGRHKAEGGSRGPNSV